MPEVIKEIVPFTFDELYTNLQTKFSDAGYDTAEGSNVTQLVTAMAYLTSMLNVNTALNINETLLPFAQKRNSVLSDARVLGYEIQHKQSFTYQLTLEFTGSPDSTYTIPKYTEFTEGASKYYYMGEQLELTNQPYIDDPIPANATFTKIITVIEGDLFKYIDYPDTLSTITSKIKNDSNVLVPQNYIDIPYIDVEENGIECFLTYYDDFGILVKDESWTKSTQFMVEADTTKKDFYRVDNIKNRTPRIHFSLGGSGTDLKLGTVVNVNILKTKGSAGAMTALAPQGIGHSLLNCVVVDVLLSTEGTEEESLQSIRTNAPQFYNSANRAVTAYDYQSFCNRQTSITDSLVWGGNEELPKSPGHIWFCFLASSSKRSFNSDSFKTEFLLDNNEFNAWDYTLASGTTEFKAQALSADTFYSSRYLEDGEIVSSNALQKGVWDVLNDYKIPTITFHNRHPIFLDFEYSVEILKYNIVNSKESIHTNIFDTIDNFFTGTNDSVNIEQFGVQYYHSSLEKRIDTKLTDDSGYNNTINTTLLLTQKNVVSENAESDYKDVFIPLSVPAETYFLSNGVLDYNVLPKIDTVDFVDYRDGSVTPADKQLPSNIRTDWSELQTQIDAGSVQVNDAIIMAPIRLELTETLSPGAVNVVTLNTIKIFPDDPSTLDIGVPTFDKFIVTVISADLTETILVKDTDWSYDVADTAVLNLTNPLLATDSIRIDSDAMCGNYILFNRDNRIMVQLYVNSVGFSYDSLNADFQTPKAYLTTTNNLYEYTSDAYYLTTEGYSLTSQAQQDILTGAIIKGVSSNLYIGSPLYADLFRRNRKMNLDYKSPNFSVQKNVLPRLKRVTFVSN